MNDIRMLGGVDGKKTTQSYLCDELQSVHLQPASSRSKVGKQIAMTMPRTSSSSMHARQSPAASMAMGDGRMHSLHGTSVASSSHAFGSSNKSLGSRPSTSGGRHPERRAATIHTGYSVSVKFAEPGGLERYQHASSKHAAEYMYSGGQEQEEDVLDMLQKRIEQQRDELRKHRENVELAVKEDVASLQTAVDSDRKELKDVYKRYRDAMDELARLRGVISEISHARSDMEADLEDAKAEARQLKQDALICEERHEAALANLGASVRDEMHAPFSLLGTSLCIHAHA